MVNIGKNSYQAQLVITKKINSSENQLDIESLSEGIYSVVIYSGDNIFARYKFVKAGY